MSSNTLRASVCSAPHPLALNLGLKVEDKISQDGLRFEARANAPHRVQSSIAASGAPMRMCFYCQRSGSMAAGQLFKLLGRQQYAHNECRERRLSELAAKRAADQSAAV